MTVDEVCRLVEDIQAILRHGKTPDEADLIDLGSRHEEFVEGVTRRLVDVESLLDRGRHDEAIDLAERVPNLNDLVTALDFPELPAWNDLLIEFDITPIAELPLEVAALLNDAYSISAPMERLLDLYRRQSLARAPVADRLHTLRQLADQDGASNEWAADVRKFEIHRINTMKVELKQAIAASDLQSIAAMDKELNSGHWSVKIPLALRNKAREAHQRLRQRNAEAELQQLAQELSDSYADFDEAKASRLKSRFTALTDVADLDSTHEVFDIAGPALDWLGEAESRQLAEAEHRQAVSNLELALNQQTSLNELEQLYAKAVRHGTPLPQLLENRLADRIEGLQHAESRRRTLWTTGTLGACLLGVVAVVFFVNSQAWADAVSGHSAELGKLVDRVPESGDLETVDEYLSTIEDEDPRYLTEPSILGLTQKFQTLKKDEQGRRDKLARLISEAQNLPAENPRWDEIDAAEQRLLEAEAITLNSDEEALVTQVLARTRKVRNSLQQQVDVKFEADQRTLVDVIDRLPKDRMVGYEAARNTAAELMERPFVSDTLKSSLKALQTKLKNQETTVQEIVAVARDLQKVTASVDRISTFRQALIDYSRSHASQQRSQEFLAVANEEEPLWAALDEWNRLRNRFERINYQTVPPVVARQLAADYAKLLSASGGFSAIRGAEQQLAALKAIAKRRPEDGESAVSRFERFFSPKPISRAYLLTTTDDKSYLLDGPPDVNASRAEFHYFLTPTGTQLNVETLSRSRLKTPEKLADEWLAPHSRFIQSLVSDNSVKLETNFEEVIVDTIQRLLAADSLDPIPRLLLTEKVLELGTECSEPLRQACDQHLSAIAKAGVSKLTNWVVADNSRAREDRAKAQQYFQRNQSRLLEDLAKVIEQQETLSQMQLMPKYIAVGWLHRSPEGTWGVALADAFAADFPIQLVAVGKSNGQSRLFPVGELKGPKIGFVNAEDVPSNAREGHRVYRTDVPRLTMDQNSNSN